MRTLTLPSPTPLRRTKLPTAVKRYWTLAITFRGRASRSEYWFSILHLGILSVLLTLPAGLVATTTGPLQALNLFGIALSVLTFVPSLAIQVRRLHDTGRSGWWTLISLIPLVGSIVLIVFFVQRGHDAPNRFDTVSTVTRGGKHTVGAVIAALVAGEGAVFALVAYSGYEAFLNQFNAALEANLDGSQIVGTVYSLYPIGSFTATGNPPELTGQFNPLGWHGVALAIAAVIVLWALIIWRSEDRRATSVSPVATTA